MATKTEDRRKPDQTIQIWNLPVLALQIIAFGVVLTALVAGQSFLMPLAIALLVWSLLQAVIERIVDFKIGNLSTPRWLATLIGVGLIVAAFLFVIDILASQADAVAAAWPRYYERLESLFAKAVEWMGQDVADEAQDAVNNIDVSSQLSGFIGSAGSILINAVLVGIYVGFLIAERGFIPRKLAALVPNDGDAKELHNIVSSVGHSVRRYMGVKTIVSVGTALASYLVLKWIELDFAETWALLIFLLNYIPNIGSILAVVFPAILALIQFDTFWPFLVIAVGLTSVHFFIGNVLEPQLMGSSLNLSSFVVIMSLTFWGVVWGLAGMFLAVPITVMLMIVCAHVPSMRWIAILLSRDGELGRITS